jgi:hypothetical protein
MKRRGPAVVKRVGPTAHCDRPLAASAPGAPDPFKAAMDAPHRAAPVALVSPFGTAK